MRNERTNVVEDQSLDRGAWPGSKTHADQAPHRRADPIDAMELQGVEKGLHLRHVIGHDVAARVVEPAASAASHHVDGDHARTVRCQAVGQNVEIVRVPCQAVRANNRSLLVAAAML